MKNVMKGLFSVVMLLSITSAFAADVAGVHSYFLGGQGTVTRQVLMGSHRDSDKMYGCFNVQVEYGQNTKRADLGKYFSLGGTDNTMVVGPRRNAEAAATDTDFYALNLLLPINYKATVTFLPKIQTTAVNLSGFIGLDEFMEGLHLQVDLPLVHTKTDMQVTQGTATGADTAYVEGLIDNTAGQTTTPPNTISEGFVEAIKGKATARNITTAMNYGKIDGAQSHFKVGNVVAGLGYDFMNKENMHLGVAVLGMFNGAGASTAEFWGEQAIGTAGRHGVGGRVNGHYRLYENDDAEINATLNADVLHVFDRTVRRSYDWTRHGAGSRYILVKEFSAASTYASIIHYGTNISSLQAKVGMDVLYDVSLNLCYTSGNLRVNGGYQLNGHGKEKHKSWVDTITGTKYGAFATTTAGIPATAASDDTGATAGIAGTAETLNTDISLNVDVAGNTGAGAATVQFGDSTAANLFETADLNTASGLAPSALAHRVHGGVHYSWADSEWEPAVGVYGGGQFGQDNTAISGWFVGFNGSVCF